MCSIEYIADAHGIDEQLNQAQEECGELIVAISKHRRYGCGGYNIAEEIADVEIMCEQLKYLLKIADEVAEIREQKLTREICRIDADRRFRKEYDD